MKLMNFFGFIERTFMRKQQIDPFLVLTLGYMIIFRPNLRIRICNELNSSATNSI
jgi:hypothetical protein